MVEKYFVRGDKIGEITTIRTFKKVMVELFKGYPAHFYFGIFETYFGKELGETIVKIIKDDELIKIVSEKKNGQIQYSLTPKGVDFAISMINLDNSEKMSSNSKRMLWITIIIAFIGVVTLFFSGLGFIFQRLGAVGVS